MIPCANCEWSKGVYAIFTMNWDTSLGLGNMAPQRPHNLPVRIATYGARSRCEMRQSMSDREVDEAIVWQTTHEDLPCCALRVA